MPQHNFTIKVHLISYTDFTFTSELKNRANNPLKMLLPPKIMLSVLVLGVQARNNTRIVSLNWCELLL